MPCSNYFISFVRALGPRISVSFLLWPTFDMKDTRADLHPCRLLTKRTLRTRILTDKVAVDRLANNSVPCMEPELSCSVHEPVKWPHTEPNTSNSHSPSYSFEIRFNIVPPSMLRSSQLYNYFGFSNQNFVCNSFFQHLCYMPCPFHPP